MFVQLSVNRLPWEISHAEKMHKGLDDRVSSSFVFSSIIGKMTTMTERSTDSQPANDFRNICIRMKVHPHTKAICRTSLKRVALSVQRTQVRSDLRNTTKAPKNRTQEQPWNMSKKSMIPLSCSFYWTPIWPHTHSYTSLPTLPVFSTPRTDVKFSFRVPGSILFPWVKKKKWKMEGEWDKDTSICSRHIFYYV